MMAVGIDVAPAESVSGAEAAAGKTAVDNIAPEKARTCLAMARHAVGESGLEVGSWRLESEQNAASVGAGRGYMADTVAVKSLKVV